MPSYLERIQNLYDIAQEFFENGKAVSVESRDSDDILHIDLGWITAIHRDYFVLNLIGPNKPVHIKFNECNSISAASVLLKKRPS